LKGLRLKKLVLAGCGLTFTTALHDLPSSLTELNVSNNYLCPDSIIGLASLTQLTELNVSNAKLAGQNPLESLAGLASLTRLTRLDVSDCSVRDVGDISRLPALRALKAAGNDIDVVRITCGLKELDLSRNGRHPILMGQLGTLTELIMGCRSVVIGPVKLAPSMEALASAGELEVLELSRMSLGAPEKLEALLRGKKRLSRLMLKSIYAPSYGNIAVMTRMLPSLARLTWLDFDGTDLSIAFVKALNAYGHPMAALRSLILSSQCEGIDGDIVALTRALQLLPALEVLNMRSALRHTDSVMTVLKYAPETLTTLDLAYNSFYTVYKGQDAARSALELCMAELHRFTNLTSVAISDPYNTNLCLVAGGSMPLTIVETVV
jgi:Leucine-rich repeat (LRR) protein